MAWCSEVRNVPFKRTGKNPLTYLEKAEIDVLLAAPNPGALQGRKDHALLLFLYNSGARASEAATVKISDLEGDGGQGGVVKLRGKGAKTRLCPLWPRTMKAGADSKDFLPQFRIRLKPMPSLWKSNGTTTHLKALLTSPATVADDLLDSLRGGRLKPFWR